MDQNKIGNFISTERKNKKLTQKELSEKLNISEKTISKWECGKGLPEVSLMKPLCKELDITVTELLNGEKEVTESNQEDGIIKYMDYTKKKSKHKVFLISILFIMLITFILSTVIYFFNTYNKIAVYELSGYNDNFSIDEMYFTKSNMYNILSTGNISVKNKTINEADIIEVFLKSGNRLIIGRSYSNFNGHTYPEKYGYSELLDDEKIANISNWYIEVSYKENNKLKKDIIKLKNEVLMKNNEFVSKKIEPIGNDTQSNEEIENANKSQLDRFNNQAQALIEKGYIESYRDELHGFYGRFVKKTSNDNYSVTIGMSTPCIEYQTQINKSTQIKINLNINSQSINEKELNGSVYKNNLIYNFSYNKESKEIQYKEVYDNEMNVINIKDYPSINNIESICQKLIDLQKELYDVLIKPYL